MKHDIIHAKNLSSVDLKTKYLLPSKPVLIEGLFSGEPISEMNIDTFKSLFSNKKVEIREEYVSYFLRTGKLKQEYSSLTISDYLELADKEPNTRMCLREFEPPEIFQSLYNIPEYCKIRSEYNKVSPSLFMANGGNYSGLHFDIGYRPVII